MATNRLSEILKSKGISQRAFAQMVDTSPQYISGIASGRLSISVKQLYRFAEVLNVPIGDLLLTAHEASVFYCPHCGMPIRVFKEGEANEEEVE